MQEEKDGFVSHNQSSHFKVGGINTIILRIVGVVQIVWYLPVNAGHCIAWLLMGGGAERTLCFIFQRSSFICMP
jgi:hypothetical protein